MQIEDNNHCLNCKHLVLSTKDIAIIRLSPKTQIEVHCLNPKQHKLYGHDNGRPHTASYRWLIEKCKLYEPK